MTINTEQLATQTLHRRSATNTSQLSGWHCNFCRKTFKYEMAFMTHQGHCKAKEKMDKVKSITGQAAYAFYADWMKSRKFSVPSSETFVNSKFFSAFFKYAEFVVSHDVAFPDIYLKLMSERGLSPHIWCNDAAYSLYLSEIDSKTDPLLLVTNSVEYLMKVSEVADITIGSVFSLLSANELIDLIKKRELSPWLLFQSKSFCKKYKEYDDIDRAELKKVINPVYWSTKFESNKELTAEIGKLADDIGL